MVVFLLIFIYMLWGGSMVTTKVALDAVPPFMLGAFRMAFSVAVVFLWNINRPVSFRPRKEEILLLLIAGGMSIPIMGFYNLGMKFTSGSRGAIFTYTNPFWVVIFAHFFLAGDRLNWQKIVGLLLAFGGVAAIFTSRAGTMEGSMKGDAIVLFSAVFLGAKLIIQKKMVVRTDPARLLFWTSLIAVPLFIFISYLAEGARIGSPSLPALLSILYLGVVISGFCFFMQIRLLKYYSSSMIASFSFLVPIFGATYSIWLLREPLTLALFVGAILVAAGIFLVNYRFGVVKTEVGRPLVS